MGMHWFDTCDCRTLNCGDTLGGETLNCGETLTRGTKMDWLPERIINDSNVVHDEEIRLALEVPKVIMQLSEHSVRPPVVTRWNQTFEGEQAGVYTAQTERHKG